MLHQQPKGGPDVRDVTAVGWLLALVSIAVSIVAVIVIGTVAGGGGRRIAILGAGVGAPVFLAGLKLLPKFGLQIVRQELAPDERSVAFRARSLTVFLPYLLMLLFPLGCGSSVYLNVADDGWRADFVAMAFISQAVILAILFWATYMLVWEIRCDHDIVLRCVVRSIRIPWDEVRAIERIGLEDGSVRIKGRVREYKVGMSKREYAELERFLFDRDLSHLLKNLSDLEESKTKGAVRFARNVSGLLREAIGLQKKRSEVPREEFEEARTGLEEQLDAVIAEKRQFSDEDNARMARQLRKQRKHLLRFLYDAEVPATNNQAERQLRPAVIRRKTGGCNKTKGGARAHAVLASIAATCKQQAVSVIEFLERCQKAMGALPKLVQPPEQPEPG